MALTQEEINLISNNLTPKKSYGATGRWQNNIASPLMALGTGVALAEPTPIGEIIMALIATKLAQNSFQQYKTTQMPNLSSLFPQMQRLPTLSGFPMTNRLPLNLGFPTMEQKPTKEEYPLFDRLPEKETFPLSEQKPILLFSNFHRIPNSKKETSEYINLEHWTDKLEKDNVILNPRFQGTAEMGEEKSHFGQSPKYIHYYLEGNEPEWRFRGKNKYLVKNIETKKIYNLSDDTLNLIDKYDTSTLLRVIKDKGYKGFEGFSGDGRRVFGLFTPEKAQKL